MLANMKTVEKQQEYVLRDMIPYTDSKIITIIGGGMNWKSVIKNE